MQKCTLFNTFNIFKLKISEKTWQWEGVMHHAIAACCLYFDIFTQNVPVVWSITLNLQGSICILLLLISYIIFCVENAYFAYACQDTPTHWRKFVRPKVVFLPKYKLKRGGGELDHSKFPCLLVTNSVKKNVKIWLTVF